MTTPDHGLVSDLGPFIGRAELQSVATRMLGDSVRWLTLHGPGGVGKTSLATRIASAWERSSAGRAWLVNVGATSESDMFADHLYSLVADAMGIRNNGTITPTVVGRHFNGLEIPEALLIFDRCDDVLGALTPLLEALLATIPRLRVIATSREKFRRDTEHVLSVTPLTLPESVALFDALLDRAGVVNSALAPKSAVTELCRSLDGLPLAVHLAARWVPQGISVQDLITELQNDRFGLLTEQRRRGSSDASERSGLERVVAFSYSRCAPDEQQTWQLLSIFRHGFDLNAAGAVTGQENKIIRELIGELVDKSVVYPDLTTGTPRWRMMDTLRDYGLRELGETGIAHARGLHRDHFAATTAQAAATWRGPHEIEVMHKVRRQLDDILDAIDHCLTEKDVMAAAAIAFNLVRTRTPHFFGVLEIVAGVLRRVIKAFGPAPDTDEQTIMLATVSAALGWVVVTQGRPQEALAMATSAKDHLARRSLPTPPQLLYPLGAIEALRSGNREAIGLLSGARMTTPDVPETAGDRHMMLMMLSMSQSFADVPEAATTTAVEYLRDAHDSQGPWSIAWALWCNALAARRAGEFERARTYMLECLQLESELSDQWGITWSVELYAWIMAAMLDTADDARAAAELAAWLLGAASAYRDAMGVDLTGLAPLAAGRVKAEEQIRRHLPEAQYPRPYEAGRQRYTDVISVALGLPPRRPTPSRVSAMADTPVELNSLSPREQDVARLVADGYDTPQIAAQLLLSPHTIKAQLRSIYKKLDGVNNRVDLARLVLQARNDRV